LKFLRERVTPQPNLAYLAKPRQARAGGPNDGEPGIVRPNPLSLTSGL
jgi:hypothetical protein